MAFENGEIGRDEWTICTLTAIEDLESAPRRDLGLLARRLRKAQGHMMFVFKLFELSLNSQDLGAGNGSTLMIDFKMGGEAFLGQHKMAFGAEEKVMSRIDSQLKRGKHGRSENILGKDLLSGLMIGFKFGVNEK